MDHGLTWANALRAPVAKVKQRGVPETRKTPGSGLSVAMRAVSVALLLDPRKPSVPSSASAA
jgi:hypothetical protein